MQVRVGLSAERPDGSWTKLDVQVDEDDMTELCTEAGLVTDSLTLKQKYKLMSDAANKFITVESARQGILTPEQAKAKLAAL